jgi:hypothetical protein
MLMAAGWPAEGTVSPGTDAGAAATPAPRATRTAATTATASDRRATSRSPAIRAVNSTIHVMLIIPSA